MTRKTDGNRRPGRETPGRRRAFGVFAALCMMLFAVSGLAGCASSASQAETAKNDGKLNVVVTLFPYYDFTRQIAGDLVDLSMVIPAGMDSHSFEPTPADIRRMQSADVLIYNGGAMEQWVGQVLDSFDTSGLRTAAMMDYVDVVEEEIVEGMEDEAHDHDHAHEDAEDHDHGLHHEEETAQVHEDGTDHNHDEEAHLHEDGADGHDHETAHQDYDSDVIEYDEHIWTSPANAMRLVQVIADLLSEADPANAAAYEANRDAYLKELSALDSDFRTMIDGADYDIMIMADKFPLRYFADEYGLRYRAAFSGCSTDTEPSAKTIAYLIDKVREEGIPAVYYLELSSPRVAEIIQEETGASPLLFHSCHNVTRRDFESGVTYLSLMRQNLENLRKGLYR